ncbi:MULTISPECIES: DUF6221 family protein [Streptomyces]|uniref:DUF6221 family protein n=1 Tax=Streptomyces bacillaris TaxID=68179 RepID=A0ABW6DTI3_9ACTN|nr:DUF6221 family protein [Streptomyces nanshensis]
MTDALVAFLKARLDDDERVARAATPGPWCDSGGYVTNIDEDGHSRVQVTDFGTQDEDSEGGGPQGQADSAHIARQDPARTLREVEAKRGLLDAALADRHHVSADQYETCPRATAADGLDETTLAALEALNEERRQEYGVEPTCWESCGRDARVRRTLELLALPYSDHPGYEEALTGG